MLADKWRVSASRFTVAMARRRPTTAADRVFRQRLREVKRATGTELRRLRTVASASQGRAAHAAGVDRSFLSRIESGVANPSIETLVAIAVALGADVSVRSTRAQVRP
jgi:DNA-binding XRE family transcriptional regulator